MKNYELDYNFKNFLIDYTYLEENIIDKQHLQLLTIILKIMSLKTKIINYCLNSKDNNCSKTFMVLESDIPNNFHDKHNLNKLKKINQNLKQTNDQTKIKSLNESKNKILQNIKTHKLEKTKFSTQYHYIISKQRNNIDLINDLINEFNNNINSLPSEKILTQLQQLLNSITNSKQYSESHTTLENWFWNKKITNELNYKYIIKNNQKTITYTP